MCLDGLCAQDPRRVCTVGSKRCNGGSVETCEATGDRWKTTEECAAGCLQGECIQQACTPNKYKCEVPDGADDTAGEKKTIMLRCVADGSAWVFHTACVTECKEINDGAEARCDGQLCLPFATRCKDGTNATLETCNSTGTAWEAAACQPSQSGGEAVCVGTRCLDTVCAAGAQRCNGDVAERCNDTRTAFEAREICAYGCNMNGATAACAENICVPGESRCQGTGSLEVCNTSGTAWQPFSCSGAAGEGRCVKFPSQAAACYPKVCSTGDQRCAGDAKQDCDPTEVAWKTNDVCEYGCADTNPASNANAVTCRAAACAQGEERCGVNGARERCASDRLSWELVRYCPAGCELSAGVTSCKATACEPLDRRCGYDSSTGVSFVEVCHGNGSSYQSREVCAQGCSNGVCVTRETGCNPGDVRCKGPEVEVCTELANGATEWRFSERCLGECSNGLCDEGGACGCTGGNAALGCGVPTRQPITLRPMLPATMRVPCDNLSTVLVYSDPIVDSAGRLVPDGTLVTVAHEVVSLETGVLREGVGYREFGLSVDDPANCREACAADAACVTWSYAKPGVKAPDGWCSLKAASGRTGNNPDYTSGARLGGGSNQITSVDAAPEIAGVQRPTLHGRVSLTVRAPSSCGTAEGTTLRVTATVGGRCSGSGNVTFRRPQDTVPPPPAAASKLVYVAEDFSSQQFHDRTQTTAAWTSPAGHAVVTPPYDYGNGADGALVIDLPDENPATPELESVTTLEALGHVRSWNALSLGYMDARVPFALPNIAIGDEVLVVTVSSANGADANYIGTYEFKRVAGVGTGRIVFDSPITKVYSANGNSNFVASSTRVAIQRVPNFTRLEVAVAATLMANPVTANAAPVMTGAPGPTGIIAFRAKQSVTILGKIDVSGAGSPTGIQPTRPSASVDRLAVGSSSGTRGGGVVVFDTALLTFKKNGDFADTNAKILALPTSGTSLGGTIRIAAGEIVVGDTVTRINANANGRLRLDFGAMDNVGVTPPGGSPPAAPTVPDFASVFSVVRGEMKVQSLVAYDEVGSGDFNIRAATLLGVLAGNGETKAVLPSGVIGGITPALPNFNVWCAADGQQPEANRTYGLANGGPVAFNSTSSNPPFFGKKFVWKVGMRPQTDTSVYLTGIAWQLQLK